MRDHDALARDIERRLDDGTPEIAIVLGSGLSSVADGIERPLSIAYDELDGFPLATVPGHGGRLLIGRLHGVRVVCMQGRHHAYEGHPPRHIALPIRAFRALGCHTLVLTNAAGSLHPRLAPGTLMVIRDHINWAGVNPLVGPNDDDVGARFTDMSAAYDPALRRALHEAAEASGITLAEGVYLMALGPSFETPAEVRAMATLGGDAVGMSTVPECLVARHCGMRVAALSLITNLGAGLGDGETLDHAETLEQGADASARIARLLSAFVPGIAA